MSFDTMLVDVTTRISKFWLNTAQRLQAARSAGPGYTANQFAAAAAGSVIDVIDIWAGLFPDLPTLLVPTIFISAKAFSFTAGVTGHGSVTFNVPSSATIAVTDLGALGGSTSIPKAAVTVVVSGTLVDVTVKTGAAPAVGAYQGFAFLSPPVTPTPQPLAQIVVVVV